MAIVQNRRAFIAGVATMVGVDMGIQALYMPSARPRATELIEYDYATVSGTKSEFNSFSKTSNTVKKDGKSIIVLAPVNFNDSISKETIDADAVAFGANEYGGSANRNIESALNGVAKLALGARIGLKAAIYEALTTHKIANGYENEQGKQDIVFNTPVNNIRVLTDGVGENFWDNAAAKPVANIYDVYQSMVVKPSSIVMDTVTYGEFYSSGEVRTADNSSTGTKRNFTLNENVDPEADFFRAGRLQEKDMNIDIYVERDTYKVAGVDTKYLDPKYVVFGSSRNGTTEYGGITRAAKGKGVTRIAAREDVEEVITLDPPQHKLVYRTAPLPLLKNGNAFYSLQVKA